MRVLTDPVEYIDHDAALYRDVRRLEKSIPGMSMTDVWIAGALGSASEPDVLTGLHRFQQALETDPEVGVAVGPTTILRLIRYLGGQGDAWPETAEEREQIAAELEGMLSLEPMLQRFVQPHQLAQSHLTVISRATDEASYRRLDTAIQRTLGRVGPRQSRARPAGAEDRRPRPPARQDGAEPRPHAGRELRDHRRHHLRDLPGGVPQRQCAR